MLLSTWASLLHITMAQGGNSGIAEVTTIALFLFLSVWLPCCTSDIVFPLLFFPPTPDSGSFSGSNTAAGNRRISIPFVEHEAFRSDCRHVTITPQPCEVAPGIWTTGQIPRTNDFEDTGGPFFLDAELTRPDPLLDDQAVYFTSQEGVVVLLGCAHAGIVNTLEHITPCADANR